MAFNIAFVLFPDFEELDFAGPWEVLAAAAQYIDPDWHTYTVAQERTVRAVNGLVVQADYTFADAPHPSMILVPGGSGARAENHALIDYVRRAGQQAEYVTSVCTGAFLLHRAGLLEGRRVTTHWNFREALQELDGVKVVAERWVHDGNVITAAGVSAGIDMALYVLGQLKSPQIARALQHYIEYDPAPPYQDVPVPEVPSSSAPAGG